MTLRIRTDASASPASGRAPDENGDLLRRLKRKQRAGTLAGAGLGAAGAVHLLWAAGSSWPAADRDALADLVVGVRPFPSSPMTIGVACLIGLGAGLVVSESGRQPAAWDQPPTPMRRVVRAATIVVPSVLAIRGAGGLVVSLLGLGAATEVFRRWDLRIYSPLCLLLAGLSALAIRNAK